jgi:hypothetical protein
MHSLTKSSLIIIPAPDGAASWIFQSGPWKDLFFGSKPSIQTLIFRYQVKLDNRFSWADFLNLGDLLLHEIVTLRKKDLKVRNPCLAPIWCQTC